MHCKTQKKHVNVQIIQHYLLFIPVFSLPLHPLWRSRCTGSVTVGCFVGTMFNIKTEFRRNGFNQDC